MSELVVEVSSRDEAGDILSADDCSVTLLISIGEEHDDLPLGYDNAPAKIRLTFSDTGDETGATRADVEQLIEAANLLKERGSGRVLIHCMAGVSRSTAAAYIIHAILLGPGREEEAMARVVEQRPIARPNWRMVNLADQLLGRNGAMVSVVNAIHGIR
ncbi:MAG: dual specificity protein phosphatase family protein [Acidobacteria bacterium]|nr:dual specificity protein phosphatase family protein [Acidobacteriota bacterium]